MRLIDADALKEKVNNEELTFDGGVDINCLNEIIDSAPTITPQGDLISRAEAIEAECSVCGVFINYGNTYKDCPHLEYCDDINALKVLPSADCVSREYAIQAIDKCRERKNKKIDELRELLFKNQEWCSKAETKVAELEKQLADRPQTYTNHEIACLLAEMFDDTCACNYNGIDEWLPLKCEFTDICPNTVGVACWEQFVEYKMADMRGCDDD